jgi:hypothetical protein
MYHAQGKFLCTITLPVLNMSTRYGESSHDIYIDLDKISRSQLFTNGAGEPKVL